ncbi:PH domain-containing protein [Mycetocola manganoxydans]|nr:PH domain-containing protein [Mycetocola manganoxydans]
MMTHPEQPWTPDPTLAEPVTEQAPVRLQAGEAADAAEATTADAPRRIDTTGEWRRVSPKYILVDLIGSAIAAVVVVVVAVVLGVIFEQAWPWWIMGGLLLAIALGAAFTPRRIRSIGYQLRQDDLLFRRGIMWTRMVAVPYGRMQLIDINRGPVARAFGLAELKFVTASAATAIVLPGLPAEEAEDLRDHLVEVAESRRTGL